MATGEGERFTDYELEEGEVRPRVTTCTAEEVAQALREALDQLGYEPTRGLVEVLVAQSALETGHWEMMYCYNIGNIKASEGWIRNGGLYTYYDRTTPHAGAPVGENLSAPVKSYWLARVRERADGQGPDMVVKSQRADGRYCCLFWPKHPLARFRAFKTLEEGVLVFVKVLAGRYRPALLRAQVGDVEGYIDQLIECGPYFTADRDGYLRGVKALVKRYGKTAEDVMGGVRFVELDDTGAYVTDIDDCELHEAGWLELDSGVQITKLPLWDEKGQLFARLGHGPASEWLRDQGMRLPSQAEYEELHRKGLFISPYTMPTRVQIEEAQIPWTNEAIDVYREKHMRSHQWCVRHDHSVFERLRILGWEDEPVGNAGSSLSGWLYGLRDDHPCCDR
jgi:hypothetical protein